MGPKRRPSGRDCALAQAALENLKAAESSSIAGETAAPARQGEASAGMGRTAQRGATLIVRGRDLLAPGLAERAIRLIDLERRARFARVAS
jgi:hypothetical protein